MKCYHQQHFPLLRCRRQHHCWYYLLYLHLPSHYPMFLRFHPQMFHVKHLRYNLLLRSSHPEYPDYLQTNSLLSNPRNQHLFFQGKYQENPRILYKFRCCHSPEHIFHHLKIDLQPELQVLCQPFQFPVLNLLLHLQNFLRIQYLLFPPQPRHLIQLHLYLLLRRCHLLFHLYSHFLQLLNLLCLPHPHLHLSFRFHLSQNPHLHPSFRFHLFQNPHFHPSFRFHLFQNPHFHPPGSHPQMPLRPPHRHFQPRFHHQWTLSQLLPDNPL